MKIRLIVPNVYRHYQTHEILPGGNLVQDYGREIAEIAGGFTATQATGGWIDGSNLLVVEPVTVFDITLLGAFHGPDHESGRVELLRNLARRIAQELRQDCVYLETDGEVEFVRA